MHVAVCDDNRICLTEMEGMLAQMPELAESVSLFSDYDQFLAAVRGGGVWDAVLMDIDWGRERTGMDVAEELCRLAPRVRVIYMTGYSDRYAQHIFLHRSNLSGYLTKPVQMDLLRANLVKAAEAAGPAGGDTLLLRPHGSPLSINTRDILYLESAGHRTTVHTAGETCTVYERLATVLQRLPPDFFQCHKSFVVNLSQIRRINTSDAVLKDGTAIPVSRAHLAELKRAYVRFVGHTF